MKKSYSVEYKVYKDGRAIASGSTWSHADSPESARRDIEAKMRSKYPGAEVAITKVK